MLGPKSGVGTLSAPIPAISNTADRRAAEREYRPQRHGDADLRHQIDEREPASPKRELRHPVSERRPDVVPERQFAADREQFAELRRRRGVEQHRHEPPQRGLGQRREPEDRDRPGAQELGKQRDGLHAR
jgi:hypothetical protein